jgi:RimJ/RimL family protein N-acetyltransferase
LPDIRAEAHADCGAGVVCAWIRDPGGTGRSISVLPPGQRGDQLYDLAEQLQDWARDVQAAPRRRPWPDCPAHPGAHRLEPEAVGETAVWWCPQTSRVVAEIGALGHAD